MSNYIKHISSLTYTFQVTKLCGYNILITVYKTETLIGLYKHILNNIENCVIKDLFFISTKGEHITIPISNKSLKSFFDEFILCNNVKLEYPNPNPEIYVLYLDDSC